MVLSRLTQRQAMRGNSTPIGATVTADGVNFCVYSAHANAMELLLFGSADDPEPEQVIGFDPALNKTYDFWHVFVPGLKAGQVYAFRADGLHAPERGLRFDREKLLIDPYGKAVVGWKKYDRAAACKSGDNCSTALRSVVVDSPDYDWQDDCSLRRPYADTVIYELHVGGFTRHSSSAVSAEKRGTFAGIIEKIPYLKELGITAVELMPVQQFDEQDVGHGLSNYWGYSTAGFFAVHHAYCIGGDPVAGINEFKDMVKALHKAGIEVILDVVYNHTSEGGAGGPTQSFKGLDNSTYYILDRDDLSRYANYTGCGNVFSANHPVVGRTILDSLRYWVSEMHVDGFRFDLAATLARDTWGRPMERPPFLWVIESDPVLAATKLIAEAWDAGGLYAVGRFVGGSQWYAEWNGPFRDDVRRFVKGDDGTVRQLAARLVASSDLYTRLDREPNRSINFITCHDGFTLKDLVSYNQKHNEENGEQNRDGADANYSWNCGVEGDSADPAVVALRTQQMKNMLTILLMSQGTPMLLMGDEVERTQRDNNNAYCHNDELSWFNWDDVYRFSGMHRFVKEGIALIQNLEVFRQTRILDYNTDDSPSVAWHGTRLFAPDWSDGSHVLAFTLRHPHAGEYVHVILNAFWEPLEFELPQLSEHFTWTRVIDTALPSPDDIIARQSAPLVKTAGYKAQPRSSVVLVARAKT